MDKRENQTGRAIWFWRGVANLASIPALILMLMFVGFAVLARETGLSLAQTIFVGIGVWAMPSQILLLAGTALDASIYTTAFTIALASVRFLPAVMALIPVVRHKNTPFWELLLIGQCSAVTGWVFAMREAPKLPRYARSPFILGFSLALAVVCGGGVTIISFQLVSFLPVIAAGALVFLTPVYFLCSMTGSAKMLAEKLALVFGIILGAYFLYLIPEYALLLSGILAGSIAYGIDFFVRRRRKISVERDKK